VAAVRDRRHARHVGEPALEPFAFFEQLAQLLGGPRRERQRGRREPRHDVAEAVEQRLLLRIGVPLQPGPVGQHSASDRPLVPQQVPVDHAVGEPLPRRARGHEQQVERRLGVRRQHEAVELGQGRQLEVDALVEGREHGLEAGGGLGHAPLCREALRELRPSGRPARGHAPPRLVVDRDDPAPPALAFRVPLARELEATEGLDRMPDELVLGAEASLADPQRLARLREGGVVVPTLVSIPREDQVQPTPHPGSSPCPPRGAPRARGGSAAFRPASRRW
jgi:hypothetical protein